MPKNKSILHRLAFPIITFAILLGLYLYWSEVIQNVRLVDNIKLIISYSIGIAIWLSLAFVFIRTLDIFLWELFLEHRLKKRIPRLIKQLVRLLIIFIAILGIVGVIFGKSVTGLLTASGVIGLVIGFAIKNLISDVFYGVAMNLDWQFRIGDYIFLHDININDVGKVLEITWRTTRLQTMNKNILVVPNRRLCTIPITNLSRNKFSNDSVEIVVAHDVSHKRADTILMSATISSPGISGNRAPTVRIKEINDKGIRYAISYWYDKNKSNPILVKNDLITNIVYHLQHAGISQGIPRTINYHGTPNMQDYSTSPKPQHFLKKMELFEFLTEDELAQVMKHIYVITLKENETIIEAGDSGDSMFLLAEGLLRVFIKGTKDKADELVQVGYIVSGEFFGEMSLLTGEPRSATVKAVVESTIITIPKIAMSKLFETNLELIKKISAVIADRHEKNVLAQEALYDSKKQTEEKQKFTVVLISKIKKFFGLEH